MLLFPRQRPMLGDSTAAEWCNAEWSMARAIPSHYHHDAWGCCCKRRVVQVWGLKLVASVVLGRKSLSWTLGHLRASRRLNQLLADQECLSGVHRLHICTPMPYCSSLLHEILPRPVEAWVRNVSRSTLDTSTRLLLLRLMITLNDQL